MRSAGLQIYCDKRQRLHKKRVQLPKDWFGTPTWRNLRQVKRPYTNLQARSQGPLGTEDLRQQRPQPGWRPAVLVKTRVWVGCSVSRTHKTWSRSFLLKHFLWERG